MLQQIGVVWLEEPFHTSALDAYASLPSRVGYIQVDSGRIGGIGPAKRVADYAASRTVSFVNRTFTSHSVLSASLQPHAGMRQAEICEYPFAPKPLARELNSNHLARDGTGIRRSTRLAGTRN